MLHWQVLTGCCTCRLLNSRPVCTGCHSPEGRQALGKSKVHLVILRLKNRRAWSAGSRDCWCVFAILLLVVCSDPSEQQDCSAGVCCPPYRFPSSSTVERLTCMQGAPLRSVRGLQQALSHYNSAAGRP